MDTAVARKDELSAFIASPFYDHWRQRVEATGGCQHPIRLSGAYQVRHKTTGALLHDHSGQIMVPCGTRRSGVCAPCADRYSADAYHLIRAGLTGDETKGISPEVASVPRVFATLTAPSFGRIHTRRLSNRGFVIPCVCGEKHRVDDTRVNGAIDPDSYDYEAAVLWQANSGELWHRFTIAVRRQLAQLAGLTVRALKSEAIVSYSKVAEYQARGLIHFHAVIRIDGPDGPGSTPPEWASTALLTEAIHRAHRSVVVETYRPTGEVLPLRWGDQIDVAVISNDGHDTEGKSGQQIAGYVAKYSTKDSGATSAGVDRPIRSREHIDYIDASAHHKAMMRTAWDLGGLSMYAELNLRRAAHKLGFRGHFLTKSQAYSTTFKALRQARQMHRFAELLESLDVAGDDVTVINGWEFTGAGHANDAERELAEGIGERIRNQRHTRKE